MRVVAFVVEFEEGTEENSGLKEGNKKAALVENRSFKYEHIKICKMTSVMENVDDAC